MDNRMSMWDVLGPSFSNNELQEQEDRHDCCMSMDFLQVLIHQHAKTIVALQELQSEVTTLKDFRNSVLSSLPELRQICPRGSSLPLGKSGTPPASSANITGGTAGSVGAATVNTASTNPGGGTCLNVGDVWTSPKLIDSGFSTETNKSSPINKSDEDDPLYSLLDLIQLKVSSNCNQIHHNCCSSCASSCDHGPKYVPNGRRISSEQDVEIHHKHNLGRLDHLLQFRSSHESEDFSAVAISRHIIGAVLREVDVVELQRQVLFGIARVKLLESRLVNLHSTTSESRLASKYLALSQENEQLRFKLKEQEIQLEGTKARLRILERLKEATAVVTSVPLTATMGTGVMASLGTATPVTMGLNPPPEPTPRKSKTVTVVSGSSSGSQYRLLQPSYATENYADNVKEEYYSTDVVPVLKESSLVNNITNNNNNNVNNKTTVSSLCLLRDEGSCNSKDESVVPGEYDIRHRSSMSSAQSYRMTSSWAKSQQNQNGHGLNGHSSKLADLDRVGLNSSNSSSGGGSGTPSCNRTQTSAIHRPSRIPVTTSRPSTPGKKYLPSTPPKSLSSISSKSSIPIAVTRLKRSQSSHSRNHTNSSSSKNKMGQFWAQWFG